MDIIIYGSKYGSAKKYAEELARRTGFELAPFQETGDINGYETIVYIGALYAGGEKKKKKTLGKLKNIAAKKIIIATVGLADPTDKENVENIRKSLVRQLSKEVFESARIFHLRGAIDYSRLNLKLKMMMALLVKKVKSLPPEKQNAETRAMLETYGKQVDFIDFESLRQIEAAI